MPTFLTPVNLAKNELQNARVQNLASAPSSPVTGQLYYDTVGNALYYWNGTSWIAAGTAGGGDADTLGGQAGSYYRSRTNHTGTQLASTISDFDTQVRSSRLDQMAAPTGPLSLNSQRITSLSDPSSAQDAATKAYVDATAQGLDIKASVRVATTANITLSGEQTIDGVSVVAGNRVLVKDQSTGSQNGIYVAAAGSWSRAADADADAEVTAGLFVFVEEGTANADSGWVLTTNAPITVGSTALTFAQFSGAGQISAGTGISKSGNTLSLDTTSGYGVRKYTTAIGNGSATDITVTHNLNSRDVIVQIYEAGSPYAQVWPDIEAATVNTVTIRFTTAPTASQYRAVVIG